MPALSLESETSLPRTGLQSLLPLVPLSSTPTHTGEETLAVRPRAADAFPPVLPGGAIGFSVLSVPRLPLLGLGDS